MNNPIRHREALHLGYFEAQLVFVLTDVFLALIVPCTCVFFSYFKVWANAKP